MLIQSANWLRKRRFQLYFIAMVNAVKIVELFYTRTYEYVYRMIYEGVNCHSVEPFMGNLYFVIPLQWVYATFATSTNIDEILC